MLTKLAFVGADEVHDNHLRCAPSTYEVGKRRSLNQGSWHLYRALHIVIHWTKVRGTSLGSLIPKVLSVSKCPTYWRYDRELLEIFSYEVASDTFVLTSSPSPPLRLKYKIPRNF